MQNISALKISFIIRRNKLFDGQAPIYARIRGLGKIAEISIQKSIDPQLWNAQKGRMIRRAKDAEDFNDYLDSVAYDLQRTYRELYREGKDITAQALKDRYLGKDLDPSMGLLEMFDYHIIRETGKLADSTLKNYHTTKRYVKEYIKKKFRAKELALDRLNFAFIDGFEVFLRLYPTPEGQRPLRNNGIMKHIERLQKVVTLAVKLDHIPKQPFKLYQRHMEKPQRTYLTVSEVEALENLELNKPGLELVKDLFLFGCYTGLAYVDMQALKPDSITLGLDRLLWITEIRRKSGQPYRVPLLPVARSIFEKYKDDPRSLNNQTCFPRFSAQKINSNLKKLARLANIDKRLTYYVARHTFATTITLTNGVPIESISRMMGHTKLSTTQIYAKVVDNKLSSDMMNLRDRLAQGQSDSSQKRAQ